MNRAGWLVVVGVVAAFAGCEYERRELASGRSGPGADVPGEVRDAVGGADDVPPSSADAAPRDAAADGARPDAARDAAAPDAAPDGATADLAQPGDAEVRDVPGAADAPPFVLPPGELALDRDGEGPAAGVEELPALAATWAGWLGVWEERGTDGEVRIRAQRLAIDGERVGPPIVVCERTGRGPRVASRGPDSLVVWGDWERDGPGVAVYAARITAEGLLLDPGGFAVARDVDPAALPGVDAVEAGWFDSVATGWFVTWTAGDQVRGARVSAEGAVRDAPGLVLGDLTSGGSAWPAVAGTSNGPALVVWEDDGVARGARVDAAGVVLDPAGLTLSPPDEGVVTYPNVTRLAEHFLVAWYADGGGSGGACPWELHGALVDPSGAVVRRLPISPAGRPVCLGWRPGLGAGAAVAWQEPDRLAVALVTPTGEVEPLASVQPTGSGAFGSTVALLLDTNGLALALSRHDPVRDEPDLFLARLLGPLLAPVSEPLHPLAAGAATQVLPAVAGGAAPVAAWCESDGANGWAVRAAAFDAQGRAASVAALSTGAGLDCWPAVAAGAGGALVAWVSDGTVKAARLDVAGRPLGEPRALGPAAVDDLGRAAASPAVAWNGTDWLVAWVRPGAPAETFALVAVRLAPDGTPTDAEPFALGGDGAPQAAAAGDGFLVVWAPRVGGFYGDPCRTVRAARIGADGALPAVELGLLRHGTAPAVIADGGGHLVVWAGCTAVPGSKSAEGPGFLAARLAGDGTLAGPPRALGEDGGAPTLAATAEGAVLAWRAADGTLVAARLAGDGLTDTTVLTPTSAGVRAEFPARQALAAGPGGALLAVYERDDETPAHRVFARWFRIGGD